MNTTPWQPVTPDWPPAGVACVLLTRTGNMRIGHRGKGERASWFIQGGGHLPWFAVVAAIVPAKWAGNS